MTVRRSMTSLTGLNSGFTLRWAKAAPKKAISSGDQQANPRGDPCRFLTKTEAGTFGCATSGKAIDADREIKAT